jgi:hypothetical protein
MPHSSNNDSILDNVVLLAVFALLLFASPIVYWWTDPQSAWYLPYALWLLVIVLGIRVFRRRSGNEHDT